MDKKGKLIFLLLAIAGMAMIFLATGINAEEKAGAPDVIEMKNTDAFKAHKKAIVMFGHEKHTAAKPDGYGIACGECHHDKDGKPLALKEGDAVQKCFECHNKTEKPKKPKGMSKDDWKKLQVEYYYGAMHGNCIGCHKAQKKGPKKCSECHPKAKK